MISNTIIDYVHFVANDPLKLNNEINSCLINRDIIFIIPFLNMNIEYIFFFNSTMIS